MTRSCNLKNESLLRVYAPKVAKQHLTQHQNAIMLPTKVKCSERNADAPNAKLPILNEALTPQRHVFQSTGHVLKQCRLLP